MRAFAVLAALAGTPAAAQQDPPKPPAPPGPTPPSRPPDPTDPRTLEPDRRRLPLDPDLLGETPEATGLHIDWGSPLAGVPAGAAASDGATVFVALTRGLIQAFETRDGTPLWRAELNGRPAGAPLLAGEVLWIASTSGLLLALDPASGQRVRSLPTGVSVAFPLASDGQRLLLASADGVVSAFEMNPLARSVEFRTNAQPRTAPVLIGDVLVVAGADGVLSAWSAADGSALWETQADGGLSGNLVGFAGALPVVIAGSAEGAVVAFDAASGEGLWRHDESGAFAGAALDGGKVLATFTSGRVAEIDLATGDVLRRRAINAGPADPPVLASGFAAVPVAGGHVILLGPGGGTGEDIDLLGTISAPLASAGPHVYAVMRQRWLYRLSF